MATKWFKAKFPNIQYKQHDSRKHGVQFDKYYRGSYQVDGKRKAINFGWSSEGWTESKVWEKINEFKHNAKTGSGPISLKEERQEREAEKQAQIEQQEQHEKDNQTFQDFYLESYLPNVKRHKKPDTVKNEDSIFRKWINPEVGHLPFNKIKPFNLEKIKKNMIDSESSPRSVQYCFAIFRQVWNTAALNEIATGFSPTKYVKIPKVENKRERFLTQEEANSLLEELENRSKQVHDMALLSLHTGCRAGEVFSLTWGVVDFENRSLMIRDAKGKPRHVFLTEQTYNMLKKRHHQQKNPELVFKDRKGNQIKSISNCFDRAIKKLELNNAVTDRRDKATFHTLRHTFASWHVQNGTDLYHLKELMGHSTIQLTERYSHLRPDGLKLATKLFEQNCLPKKTKMRSARKKSS
ncbi:tyrosine-type recombinase/integrase [uncultured Desulfobacter sp.]|uniref:tyrosine-type recombinase/integrase n=1 Tax=uncultured Desulfobacter sp. TaxID=240139 RepID=UPI0029F45CCC|nr:tyrosine-type recombinase/integrase [uncultured Desulfobacter sp.]